MKFLRTRRQRMMLTSTTPARRRFQPFALITCIVTLLVVLGAGAIFVIPRIASHAAGDPNANCSLLVPANPLSAQGLATPYQLSATNPADGPCNESNVAQSAFVQGVIYDPAKGTFGVYNPLVVDKGTQPAVAPTAPALPRGAVVGLWFGFNGDTLQLQGANRTTLLFAGCVNGLGKSLFGQFAYCNAPAFFAAANRGIATGKVKVPALQTANDGQACPTVRDFSVVDQDQSDNVQTQYLATANGQMAQLSDANKTKIPDAITIGNPSDNALLTSFIDPALGCQAWQVPDLANGGNTMVSALPLDELQAAANQKSPVALVPLTNPMTLANDKQSLQKTDLYRWGVDQPFAFSSRSASGTTYCQNMVQTGLARIQLDQPMTSQAASPDTGAANSLFTFLAQRFMGAYDLLNCGQLLKQANPVTVQTDGNGIAISATITLGNNNGNNGNNGNNNGANNGGTNGATTPTPTAADGNGNGNGAGAATPTPAATDPAGNGGATATPTANQ